MLERHEPLWRYLTYIDGKDPLTAMMQDIECMAKDNLLSSDHGGRAILNLSEKNKQEAQRLLQLKMPPRANLHHMMFQAIKDKLFITMSRISETCSKTSLALCINEDDTVSVDYFEHNSIMRGDLTGKTLWNSISTVVAMPDGTLKRGFVRVETTFMVNSDNACVGLKCDFKLGRSHPLFVHISSVNQDQQVAITGAKAKVKYQAMEAAWTALSTC